MTLLSDPHPGLPLGGGFMKHSANANPQQIVENFAKSFAPWIRCVMLPPMVAALASQDFDELWTQLEPYLKDDLVSRERSRDSLAMVERWAHEAVEMAERYRSERESQDSTIEPSRGETEDA